MEKMFKRFTKSNVFAHRLLAVIMIVMFLLPMVFLPTLTVSALPTKLDDLEQYYSYREFDDGKYAVVTLTRKDAEKYLHEYDVDGGYVFGIIRTDTKEFVKSPDHLSCVFNGYVIHTVNKTINIRKIDIYTKDNMMSGLYTGYSSVIKNGIEVWSDIYDTSSYFAYENDVIILPDCYWFLNVISNNYLIAKPVLLGATGWGVGIIDKAGKIILPLIYDEVAKTVVAPDGWTDVKLRKGDEYFWAMAPDYKTIFQVQADSDDAPYEKVNRQNISVPPPTPTPNPTPKDTILISSEMQLRELLKGDKKYLSNNFKLVNDITLTMPWLPVGSEDAPFTGTFDGDGYSIKNVNITIKPTDNYMYIGFLGYVDNGIIKNLCIDVAINAETSEGVRSSSGKPTSVGGLVGFTNGQIENCSVSGSINSQSYYTGGIVGTSWGWLNNSRALVNINSKGFAVGGLVGRSLAIISQSYFSGKITSECQYVGGLVGSWIGQSDRDIIDNCYAIGEITLKDWWFTNAVSGVLTKGENVFAGGLIGNAGIARPIVSISNYYSAIKYNSGVGQTFGLFGSSFYANSETIGELLFRDSFYDASVVGSISMKELSSSNKEGKPLSTNAMKNKASYTNWDFNDIWGIDPAINDGYPYLRHFYNTGNGDKNTNETLKSTYTVTFKDWNGTTLKTQTVDKGQSATAPATPSREGYTFTGWDKSFTNVTSDLAITAQYAKKDVSTNKFIMDEDNYNFTNSRTSFGYPADYKIPFERYKKLYTATEVKSTWGTQENDYRKTWAGSCFGFSSTSVLMNLQKLTIPGSAKYAYSLLAPNTPFSEITELIETYQVSWSLYDIWNTARINKNDFSSLINAVNAANGEGVVITIAKNSNMDGYHAVVAYDIARISDGVYALSIYDSNDPNNKNRVMQVNTNSKSFSYYDYGKDSTAFFEYIPTNVINNAVNNAINDKAKSNGISGPGSRMTISAPSGTRIANLADSTFIEDNKNAYKIVEPSLDSSVAERVRQMWSVPNTGNEVWSTEISDNTVNQDISFYDKSDAMTVNSNAESGGIVGTPSQVMIIGDGSKEFDFAINYTTVATITDSYAIKGTTESYFSVEVRENKLLLEGDTNSVEVYRRNGKSETVKLVDGKGEIILDNTPEKVITLQIDKPNMTVNGTQKEIDPGRGTVPLVNNGRTLLPIRAIAEELGATVEWDSTESKVTITQGNTKISVWINKGYAYIGSTFVTLDVPPQLINERTMIPVRFVAEALDCAVIWEGTTKTVTILR